MQLVDSWRLFGPNLQTPGPAALAEVSFDPDEDVEAAVAAWKTELSRMSGALGLEVRDPAARVYRGGAVLTFSAPIDVLLPATDINEWAVVSAAGLLRGDSAAELEPRRGELAEALSSSASPRLLALQAAASQRGLPFIWDDDWVTIGAGKGSETWPRGALPEAHTVAWSELFAIPLALVTGTNGKTTSARLLSRILKCAGHVVGMTTTDGAWVGEELIEAGDYTGPAGAGLVLRRREVTAAVLETARGGILRRGLAIQVATAALLTNVSDDHLGHYGIDDLGALARTKAVVASVVAPDGCVVVNAEDPRLMELVPSFTARQSLFALDPGSPVVAQHCALAGEAWIVKDGWIIRKCGSEETLVIAVADVPVGFRGAAPYNIANALGAAACARALGISDTAITEGLRSFASSRTDNPGRGNLMDIGGVQVLVDFAHNPAGIRTVLSLVARLRSATGRLIVIAGYAGDRSDASVREAARAIHDSAPSRVLLRDLEGYLRGRAPGEVPALFRDELTRLGSSPETIDVAPSEAEALRRALASATPGDFVVILAHLESAEMQELLTDGRGPAT